MPNFSDNDFTLVSSADNTKHARFSLSSYTAGVERILKLPNYSGTATIASLELGGTFTGAVNCQGSLTISDFLDPTKTMGFDPGSSANTTGTLTSIFPTSVTDNNVALPPCSSAMPGVLVTQTSSKTVANTVTETTIFGTMASPVGSLTLPANLFIAGRTIRINMSGRYSTVAVTGDIVTVKIKYGSTVLATKATTGLVTGATNQYWQGEVLITCRTTGATGTVMTSGCMQYQIAANATVTDELNNAGATTTINTTTSNAIDVTVTHSAANASNTITSLVGTVEVLN